MGDALAVFLQNAVLKPGRYQYHNPLAKLDSSDVFDVFRDEATGETPEHITFEVTDEHLRLLSQLSLEWDEEYDVPSVDRSLMSDDIDAKTRAAERAERAERMAREGQQAMAEHLAAVKAVDERTVRLRALRLAKEAEEAAERAANPPAPKRGRKKATA